MSRALGLPGLPAAVSYHGAGARVTVHACQYLNRRDLENDIKRYAGLRIRRR